MTRLGLPEYGDSIDALLADWARERPDLDFAPVGVVTRMGRVRAFLEAGLGEVFEAHGLSASDFQVVVNLRRAGSPFRLPQARLKEFLGLTSGTVSVRIDRLAARGVVVREPDPEDARVQFVRLTEAGLALFDVVAPAHLRNEDRMLSALEQDERKQLAGLLRRLLRAYERPGLDLAAPLGLHLEQAHVARARRAAVGLSDVPGLLIVDVVQGSPAFRAGAARGDLIVQAGSRVVRSEECMRAALGAVPKSGRLTVTVLRGEKRLRLSVTGLPSGAAPSRAR